MNMIPPPPQSIPSTVAKVAEKDDDLTSMVKAAQPYLSQEVINSIILNGDLSKLSPNDKTAYYIHRCRNLGLDPATKPFDLLKLQGKEVLYANKTCAAQLRALNKISTTIIEEKEWGGLLVVKVRAFFPDGRQHEDEGFATIAGLGGEALGNARLKAMTKATRRAILHLCGLGELDETEVESISGARTSTFAEAKAVLAIPKQVNGTDAITVVDIKGADANTDIIEVLDNNSRVWLFQGKDTHEVALKAVGTANLVMIEFSVENGQYIVRSARM
jgi:hypothetical protein